MKKPEAVNLVSGATVTDRGDAWGDRLWTVDLIGPLSRSIDVHADTEDDARAAAVQALLADA